jgi:four helix bundle protein
MRMRRYRDLEVWEYSMDLAVAAYRWTAGFPRAEQFGVTSQIRRAAVSIPCNIAEGQGRAQPGEFLNQLSVAPVRYKSLRLCSSCRSASSI